MHDHRAAADAESREDWHDLQPAPPPWSIGAALAGSAVVWALAIWKAAEIVMGVF